MATGTRPVIVDSKVQGDRIQVDTSAILMKRRLTYVDFAAAATTGNLDIAGFPPGVIIIGAHIFLVTNFTGGAVSAATLSVGTTASAAIYVAATSVFTGAPKPLVGLTLVPGTYVNATTPLGLGTVRVQLITTTANTNALTAGKADLFLHISASSIKST